MKAIPFQEDGVTELAANDFNQIPREEENLITSTAQVLDGGDVRQMAKAAATYAGRGDYYENIGTALNAVLIGVGNMEVPTEYVPGLRARFVSEYDQVGVISARIGSLAALPISRVDVPNGGTATLEDGDILSGEQVELIYSTSPDTVYKYWKLNSVIGTQRVKDFDLANGSGNITVTDGSELWQQGATGLWYTGSGGQVQMNFEELAMFGTFYSTKYSSKGVKYSEGPGEAAFQSLSFRKSGYLVTAGSWTETSLDSRVWYTNGLFFETDIPSPLRITGLTIVTTGAGPVYFTIPATGSWQDMAANPGLWTIRDLTVVMGNSGTPDLTFELFIEYAVI